MAHAFQMTPEMAFGHESGDGLLLENGMPGISFKAGAHERRHQSRRHDEIAKAKSGKHHLAERAGINNPILMIETFQSRQWTPRKSKLAVVVVFEHIGLCIVGP